MELDAFNRGNADLAVEQFTDDAMVVAGPVCTQQKPCSGKAAIRQNLFLALIPTNFAIKAREVVLDGQSLRSKVEISTNGIRQVGVARIIGSDTIEFRGGKIASLVFKPDPGDTETARWLQTIQAPSAPSASAQR